MGSAASASLSLNNLKPRLLYRNRQLPLVLLGLPNCLEDADQTLQVNPPRCLWTHRDLQVQLQLLFPLLSGGLETRERAVSIEPGQ